MPGYDYTDYATVNVVSDMNSSSGSSSPCPKRKGPRGGVKVPFPLKLHKMLEENLYEDIVSWQPHGRSFLVHKPQEFVDVVMPKYFQQSKLTSFQRQLNLYGFTRQLSNGPDKGGYYHELFLRGKGFLCNQIMRMRIKGPKSRQNIDPEKEPRFYSMPSVPPTRKGEGSKRKSKRTYIVDKVPSRVSESTESLLDDNAYISSSDSDSVSDIPHFPNLFSDVPEPQYSNPLLYRPRNVSLCKHEPKVDEVLECFSEENDAAIIAEYEFSPLLGDIGIFQVDNSIPFDTEFDLTKIFD